MSEAASKSHEHARPDRTADASRNEADRKFEIELLEVMPFLNKFSRALCRDATLAEDMAQEALAKAWRSRANFQANSNLKAWLFTILRNELFSHRRRAWRLIAWEPAVSEAVPDAGDEQLWAAELSDTVRALSHLPREQRDALVLLSVGGYSYEDTAAICCNPAGTIKSRVARARVALRRDLENPHDKAGTRPEAGNALNAIVAHLEHLTNGRTRAPAPE